MNRRVTLLFTLIAFVAAISLLGIDRAAAQSEGQIGGIVYEDANGNNIREVGEEGVRDVEVTFTTGAGDDIWETSIATAADGSFSIALNPSTWTVSIAVPAGFTAPNTSQEIFIEQAGDSVTNVEFGLIPAGTDTTGGEDGGDDEILPDSGGPISGSIVVAGLFGIMAVGGALVVIGQRRNSATAA
ncbi:MAG: hypothetical protein GYB68_01630 [Chloroflexi bacterium]|nr:hypothetical protein [Chloroflexota bacterium]